MISIGFLRVLTTPPSRLNQNKRIVERDQISWNSGTDHMWKCRTRDCETQWSYLMVFIMGSPNIVNPTATRLVSEPAFVRIPKPQRTYSLENNLRCAEVVSEDSVYIQRPPSTEAPSSRSLKFGVDRILSDEIAPNKKTSG